MLVKVLSGVFDPPPEHLVVPWAYAATLATAAVVATAIAVLTTEDDVAASPGGGASETMRDS